MISLWPGSIAGRRRRRRGVAGLRADIGRGLAAATALALLARNVAFLARRDPHALHPPRIGVEHLDLEITGPGNQLAAHRHAADKRHQIAAERFDLLAGFARHEVFSDHGADIVEARPRIADERVVRLTNDRRRL